MLTLDTKIDELAFKIRVVQALAKMAARSPQNVPSPAPAKDGFRSNERVAISERDVDELALDPRMRRALRRLGVTTVGDFLALDMHSLPGPRGCGPVTLQRLQLMQEILRRRFEALRTGRPSIDLFSTSVDLSLGLAPFLGEQTTDTEKADLDQLGDALSKS